MSQVPAPLHTPGVSGSSSIRTLWTALLAAGASFITEPEGARAYSTQSVLTDGCHERIAAEAIRLARAELGGSIDAIAPNANERALMADVPFDKRGIDDFGGIVFILGDRNIDLRGHDPDDLDQLAPLHADPDHQAVHCLRRPSHNNPEGDELALSECREVIRNTIQRALEGLDANGRPDPERRTHAKIFLELRDSVDADLPTYHFQMGRALHTIQDGYSHLYRTPDLLGVTAVLNYVELAEDRLNESVDGPPHSSALDRCEGIDAFRRERLARASQTSAEFLVATLAPGLSGDERLARVDGVLAKHFTYVPGCTFENDYCDAPERKYRISRGCSLVPRGPGSSIGPPAVLLGAWALYSRRRRPRASLRSGSRRRTTCPFWARAVRCTTALAAALTIARPANAQPSAPVAGVPAGSGASGAEGAPAMAASDADAPTTPFGMYLSGSAALKNTALAASLGGRYRLSENWLVGVDAEYNPWIGTSTGSIRPGILAFFGTLILRYPMRLERVDLRTTVHVGSTHMLFDLLGVPKGTVGIYVGANFLGLDYQFSRGLYLVVDPANIVYPIVKVTEVPFAYPQYRFTVGLQWGA